MAKAKHNYRIDITDTVSAFNAPESIFQTRAGDYTELVHHHTERGGKSLKMKEGTIPHN